MYRIGAILLVRNYRLPTAVKDKFFIVMGTYGDQISLLSMTTSKIYFSSDLLKHGLILDREMSVYCFKAGMVVGENGFAFHKDTIVSHRNNIHSVTQNKLDELEIELMDYLTKKELTDLVYSFYTCRHVTGKYKMVLEGILEELTKEE